MHIVHVALIAGSLASLWTGLAFSAALPGASPELSQSTQQNPPAAVPAASVIASVPYQVTGATDAATCNTSGCRFFFPLIAANQRLDIQFVSCRLIAAGLQVGDAKLGINDADVLPHHFLEGSDHPVGGNNFFIVSQPVVFSVPANKRPSIRIFYAPTTLLGQRCSISGVLQFLQ